VAVSELWHLTYDAALASEPVLWELGRRVHTNIRRANVEESVGWVIVEVRGADADLAGAREWLVSRGVGVEVLSS
jgi:hypothetical protein